MKKSSEKGIMIFLGRNSYIFNSNNWYKQIIK